MQALKFYQTLNKLKSLSSFRVLSMARHVFHLVHLLFSIQSTDSASTVNCLVRLSFPLENAIQRSSFRLQAMFYSHESTFPNATARSRACQLTILSLKVLTSREGGVATVWYVLPMKAESQHSAEIDRLVATLGSRSNSKKINRKAILDVNVPKTCSIIIQPEAPMALRLQSNLL